MIEVVDKSEGKRRKILSAGKSRFGVLAQGDDTKESNLFKEIHSRRHFAMVSDKLL